MGGTYKKLKKAVVFVAGMTVIIVGIILLAIPGPGLLTIAVGLLILSSEFEWAERHLKNVRKKIRQAYEKSKNKQKKPENNGQKKK